MARTMTKRKKGPGTIEILHLFLEAFKRQHGIELSLSDMATRTRLLVSADELREELEVRDPVRIMIPYIHHSGLHLEQITVSRADFPERDDKPDPNCILS